ncbi:hypothetical protein JJB98_04095 [Bradyrhizobium diazoefficiens]|nr:hypothetical protein [Bradyrhizobium diazoefficiens]QQO19144.1 hypothetical protein JJB98_04095 [Bradyrhizobium diazoefficiens]
MKDSYKEKPVAAGTANGLQIIERFGTLLAIEDMPALTAWQTCPRHIIYIEALGKSRFSVRYIERSEGVLLISRQPLLDSARLFLKLGCDPRATIAMRRRGSTRDDLIGIIGGAAKLTVDETKTAFAKWKPFSPSAVTPPSAPDAAPPAGVALARKSRHGSDGFQETDEPADAQERKRD